MNHEYLAQIVWHNGLSCVQDDSYSCMLPQQGQFHQGSQPQKLALSLPC